MEQRKKAVGILAIGLAFIIVAVGTYVCGYFIGREAGRSHRGGTDSCRRTCRGT